MGKGLSIAWRDLLHAQIIQKPHSENSHHNPGVFQPSNSCLLTSLLPNCLVCIWSRFLYFTYVRKHKFPSQAIRSFAEVSTSSHNEKNCMKPDPTCVEHIGTINTQKCLTISCWNGWLPEKRGTLYLVPLKGINTSN